MDASFQSFVQWAFYSLITGLSIYIVQTLMKLKDSVEDLKLASHEQALHREYQIEKIKEQDHRISRLEGPHPWEA